MCTWHPLPLNHHLQCDNLVVSGKPVLIGISGRRPTVKVGTLWMSAAAGTGKWVDQRHSYALVIGEGRWSGSGSVYSDARDGVRGAWTTGWAFEETVESFENRKLLRTQAGRLSHPVPSLLHEAAIDPFFAEADARRN